MKKSFVICSGVSFLVLGLAVTAVANETGMDTHSSVALNQSSLDSSVPAVEPKIHKRFVKLDKNSDGFIDAAEAKKNKRLNAAFRKIATAGRLDETTYAEWAASSKKK